MIVQRCQRCNRPTGEPEGPSATSDYQQDVFVSVLIDSWSRQYQLCEECALELRDLIERFCSYETEEAEQPRPSKSEGVYMSGPVVHLGNMTEGDLEQLVRHVLKEELPKAPPEQQKPTKAEGPFCVRQVGEYPAVMFQGEQLIVDVTYEHDAREIADKLNFLWAQREPQVEWAPIDGLALLSVHRCSLSEHWQVVVRGDACPYCGAHAPDEVSKGEK